MRLWERLPWGHWALDRHTALEVVGHLQRARPRVIVEAGSGASTVLLAAYAATQDGVQVVSLEHDRGHLRRTRDLLARYGLAGRVDLRYAPLAPVDTPDGAAPWYDTRLPPGVDFALIDGPPGTVGRRGALYALQPALRGAWQVWLDDADRPGESAALHQWQRHLGVGVHVTGLPRGLARITDPGTPAGPGHVDARDVAVTLLTGGRPALALATVDSLRRAAPGLLDTAHVTVLHNGADTATAALIEQWEWADKVITREPPMLPVGAAVSVLAGTLPAAGRRYWLHLEDDWTAATLHDGWLADARAALDDPLVGQVRLRHRAQPVRRHHMATGIPIAWQPAGPRWAVGLAHYTLNPSLMRAQDAGALWPAGGEPEAMRAMLRRGWLTAQAHPGVFHHAGNRHSLQGHTYV